LWGGSPGPQPVPWPACRCPDLVDFIGEERVQGDPCGPGALSSSSAENNRCYSIGPNCASASNRLIFIKGSSAPKNGRWKLYSTGSRSPLEHLYSFSIYRVTSRFAALPPDFCNYLDCQMRLTDAVWLRRVDDMIGKGSEDTSAFDTAPPNSG
jgi:hypothetical protein